MSSGRLVVRSYERAGGRPYDLSHDFLSVPWPGTLG